MRWYQRMIKNLFLTSLAMFIYVSLYYSRLSLMGIKYKMSKDKSQEVVNKPSLDVLLPAHNEGVVIKDTLDVLSKLKYSGELNIYKLLGIISTLITFCS